MKKREELMDMWSEMESAANDAIVIYDMGDREEGRATFLKIWHDFQEDFALYETRQQIGDAYQEAMSMVLNRLYLDLCENKDDQQLWDFCWQVCSIFRPEEIWLEDYVCCIGALMQKRGQYEECDEWFLKYHELEPAQSVYMAQWAHCLMRRGNPQKALQLLDEVLQKNLKCDAFHLNYYLMAWKLYEALNEPEKAELCKNKIIEEEELLLEDADELLTRYDD